VAQLILLSGAFGKYRITIASGFRRYIKRWFCGGVEVAVEKSDYLSDMVGNDAVRFGVFCHRYYWLGGRPVLILIVKHCFHFVDVQTIQITFPVHRLENGASWHWTSHPFALRFQIGRISCSVANVKSTRHAGQCSGSLDNPFTLRMEVNVA